MAKFKPGDRARIVYAEGNCHHLLGRECTIVALLDGDNHPLIRYHAKSHEQWYRLDVDNHPRYVMGPDSDLEPIVNPGKDARTWFEKNIKVDTSCGKERKIPCYVKK